MDVKTTFLHGFLKQEVFVEQPQGFEEHDKEINVCRLKKALFGQKQAPIAWYARIYSYLIKFGFTRSSFLHGFLKQEVFVEQPQGFEEHDKETNVCRLKKALFGLKQAPRAWNTRIDSYLIKFGFTRSSADLNLYFKIIQGIPLILVLYVDDLFLT